MGTVKVSVTLQEEHVREAKQRAGAGGLSAYLDDMLRRQLQRERLQVMLDEWEREDPTPVDEREAAQRWVDEQWPKW
ncbi:MAG: CopG family transcriptional regulator [Chloroflexi bacterium]|nr:CopG family transcriptional regulator [Chloroflexota bacterium]